MWEEARGMCTQQEDGHPQTQEKSKLLAPELGLLSLCKAEFLFESLSVAFCYGSILWYNKPLIILNFTQHCFPESLKYEAKSKTQHIGLKSYFPAYGRRHCLFSEEACAEETHVFKMWLLHKQWRPHPVTIKSQLKRKESSSAVPRWSVNLKYTNMK